MIKTIPGITLVFLIVLLLVGAALSYTNGDLWPASILQVLSLVAIVAAWCVQKYRSRPGTKTDPTT